MAFIKPELRKKMRFPDLTLWDSDELKEAIRKPLPTFSQGLFA
jgi:hypothetical protein